ncbi:hypothetical protein RRU94_01890 [Domibacillus sp. DTU_2020_1001157_1_SI_ALB_TIR_016]|uniref:hypothetical protein n=1 Tax=Domibacillus sp. DTU_2020_1001157_1_SI_ALB_TIR_016 TaxID=3077789 RepID=UPI0028E23BDC|nr:hypothetical protein [Domibacillus sp. DTU_2020_1001157_1_SI_ALB_TIR_016]WNS78725.1 hypothetical protein RRU94_01890 [Domibacillus sp. DTU_2020_1001157_1_SI_ALB_TIR_016]
MKKPIIFLLFVLNCLLAACSEADSKEMEKANLVVDYSLDYPRYTTQTELEQASDLIVEGNVLDSKVESVNISLPNDSNDPRENPTLGAKEEVPEEENEFVYTISKVEVTQVYKGDNVQVGDVIEVKQLGGKLDGVTYTEENANPIKPKNEYIVFLAAFPNEIPYSLVNPEQGSYQKENGKYKAHQNNKIKLDVEKLKKIKTQK